MPTPQLDTVIVAPATYNTINNWAAGIADNYVLTQLAELTGLGVRIVVLPLVNQALASNLAFQQSVRTLRDARVPSCSAQANSSLIRRVRVTPHWSATPGASRSSPHATESAANQKLPMATFRGTPEAGRPSAVLNAPTRPAVGADAWLAVAS